MVSSASTINAERFSINRCPAKHNVAGGVVALAIQAGVGVGRRRVGVVGAALTVELHLAVAPGRRL
jgi:hypothetical protein